MANPVNSSNLNYTVLVPCNGTGLASGDPMVQDLNAYYNGGNIIWMILSTVLVILIIPGVGLFHAKVTRRDSVLPMLWIAIMSACVISFQWLQWGSPLTFTSTCVKLIDDLQNIVFIGVLAAPSAAGNTAPNLLLALFRGVFATLTVMLAIFSTPKQVRVVPCLLFISVWLALIYSPIACWMRNPAGWAFSMGGPDFASSTPVHIVSGSTALAYAFMSGQRRGNRSRGVTGRLDDATLMIMGTACQLVGSFGFNAGSALSVNLRAVRATMVINIAAGVGGIAWCLLDYRRERKWSSVGFCSGVVSGLVVISPGSGLVPPWSALIYGVVGAVSCRYSTKLMAKLPICDPMDAFAIHGIGGFVGNILTGVFASSYMARLDGATRIYWTLVNPNYTQIACQLANAMAVFVYAFCGTCAILFAINGIDELGLRGGVGRESSGSVSDAARVILPVTRTPAPSLRASGEDETTGLRSNSAGRAFSYGTHGVNASSVAGKVDDIVSSPGQSAG